MTRWLTYLLVLVLTGTAAVACSSPPESVLATPAQRDDFCGGPVIHCPRTGASVCTCTLQAAPKVPHREAAVVLVFDAVLPVAATARWALPEPALLTSAWSAGVPTPPPRG